METGIQETEIRERGIWEKGIQEMGTWGKRNIVKGTIGNLPGVYPANSSAELEHLNFTINWELLSWTKLEGVSFIWLALGSEHAYWQRGYNLF